MWQLNISHRHTHLRKSFPFSSMMSPVMSFGCNTKPDNTRPTALIADRSSSLRVGGVMWQSCAVLQSLKSHIIHSGTHTHTHTHTHTQHTLILTYEGSPHVSNSRRCKPPCSPTASGGLPLSYETVPPDGMTGPGCVASPRQQHLLLTSQGHGYILIKSQLIRGMRHCTIVNYEHTTSQPEVVS